MRRLALIPTWAWLMIGVAAPVALLIAVALGHAVEDVPPFTFGLSPDNLWAAVADPFYRGGLLGSLRLGVIAAVLCLALGYPMALAIARADPRRRSLLLMALMLPFWTGFLLRIAAWIGILRDDGWLDAALQAMHLTSAPLQLLHSDTAMVIGIVHAYLPFMVLPLQAQLSRLDPMLVQAAADLGASPAAVFRRVTWPLSLPGIVAGAVLVFVPVTGEYVIPDLLGAPDSQTMGRVIWDEFFSDHDWPMAAALAVVLLAISAATLALAPAWRAATRRARA